MRVSDLRALSDVNNSAPVRFAKEIFSAVGSRNYARFFQLLRTKATYLQACMMHLSFPEMRFQALSVIHRAYNAAQSPQITLAELVTMLCFEDEQHAAAYVMFHGATVDHRGYLSFEQGAPVMPTGYVCVLCVIQITCMHLCVLV